MKCHQVETSDGIAITRVGLPDDMRMSAAEPVVHIPAPPPDDDIGHRPPRLPSQ